MSKKYNVGVFGIGAAAREYIKAFEKNAATQVVAAVGRDAAQTGQRMRDIGLDKCIVYKTYDEMIDDEELDIIVNTGPHQMHAAEIIKAADKGMHVMFEKPAGMNFAEVMQVYDAVTLNGVKSQQGTPILLNPFVKNALKFIQDDMLGEIFYIQAGNSHELGPWWNGWTWGGNMIKGGPSAVLVTGIHAIAFMMKCAGDVEEVSGYQTWGHRDDFEYAPTFTASLKFKSGAVGSTYSTYENRSPYTRNFIIHGTKGSIYDDKFFLKESFPGQADWQKFSTIMPDSGAVSHHAFEDLVNDFIDAIVNDTQTLVNIEETRKIHEVCFALTEALETGKIVKLPLNC